MVISQRRFNYQKRQETEYHDKRKNKSVATIIKKKICPHQSRKIFKI